MFNNVRNQNTIHCTTHDNLFGRGCFIYRVLRTLLRVGLFWHVLLEEMAQSERGTQTRYEIVRSCKSDMPIMKH